MVIGSAAQGQARFPALDFSYVQLFRVSCLDENHFNESFFVVLCQLFIKGVCFICYEYSQKPKRVSAGEKKTINIKRLFVKVESLKESTPLIINDQEGSIKELNFVVNSFSLVCSLFKMAAD